MLEKVQEQSDAVRYLKRVVAGSLVSPLLLVGEAGVGRRFSVMQTAKELFSGGDPTSRHCLQIDYSSRGNGKEGHPDITVVGAEAEGIGIDAVREIIELVSNRPVIAVKRFVVIDGAERMTNPAANALLKTLEEQPKQVQFFLLTESERDVIPTLRSRCGTIRYKRLSEAFICRSLTETFPGLDNSLVYARLAEGSLGRAFEYVTSNRLAFRDQALGLLKLGLGGDVASIFSAVKALEKDAEDASQKKEHLGLTVHFLEHLLYDLTMLPHDPARIANLDLAEDLAVLREGMGQARVRRLQDELRGLQQRARSARIHMAFHLKAALATAFTE